MSVPSWHGGLKLARGMPAGMPRAMPIWHGTVPVPGTLGIPGGDQVRKIFSETRKFF